MTVEPLHAVALLVVLVVAGLIIRRRVHGPK